jgi:hypothetical protein
MPHRNPEKRRRNLTKELGSSTDSSSRFKEDALFAAEGRPPRWGEADPIDQFQDIDAQKLNTKRDSRTAFTGGNGAGTSIARVSLH